jgi:hypothetical protein
MENLEAFHLAALETLHCCLKTFPVRTELDPKEISKVVAQFFATPEKPEEIFSHITNFDEICLYTIWWLRDEGFIDIKNQTMDGLSESVLHLMQFHLYLITKRPLKRYFMEAWPHYL